MTLSLTGTAGPGERQWKLEKGAVADSKATFEVQQLRASRVDPVVALRAE